MSTNQKHFRQPKFELVDTYCYEGAEIKHNSRSVCDVRMVTCPQCRRDIYEWVSMALQAWQTPQQAFLKKLKLHGIRLLLVAIGILIGSAGHLLFR